MTACQAAESSYSARQRKVHACREPQQAGDHMLHTCSLDTCYLQAMFC